VSYHMFQIVHQRLSIMLEIIMLIKITMNISWNVGLYEHHTETIKSFTYFITINIIWRNNFIDDPSFQIISLIFINPNRRTLFFLSHYSFHPSLLKFHNYNQKKIHRLHRVWCLFFEQGIIYYDINTYTLLISSILHYQRIIITSQSLINVILECYFAWSQCG